MNTPAKSLTRARKYLDVFGDWKAEHDAAMACYDLEEWMAEGLSVLRFLDAVNDGIRRAAYRGLITPTDEDDDQLRLLFQSWQAHAESGLTNLTDHEGTFGDVTRGAEFRDAIGRVRALTASWPPVIRSEMLAAHNAPMTDDEAADLRGVLMAEPGTPGTLLRPVRDLPTGGAALLR